MFNNTWEQQRIGKFTSSEIWKLMSSGKKATFSQTGLTYIRSKAAELITGEKAPDINSNAIEYGRSLEQEAFEYFKMTVKSESAIYYGIENPKFFSFGDFAGGSPDGEYENAILEIKCPYNSGNHITHLMINSSDELKDECPEYYWQIQANMLFTGKELGFFVSYDPRVIKHEHRIKILCIMAENQELIKHRIDAAALVLSDILKSIKYI